MLRLRINDGLVKTLVTHESLGTIKIIILMDTERGSIPRSFLSSLLE